MQLLDTDDKWGISVSNSSSGWRPIFSLWVGGRGAIRLEVGERGVERSGWVNGKRKHRENTMINSR